MYSTICGRVARLSIHKTVPYFEHILKNGLMQNKIMNTIPIKLFEECALKIQSLPNALETTLLTKRRYGMKQNILNIDNVFISSLCAQPRSNAEALLILFTRLVYPYTDLGQYINYYVCSHTANLNLALQAYIFMYFSIMACYGTLQHVYMFVSGSHGNTFPKHERLSCCPGHAGR